MAPNSNAAHMPGVFDITFAHSAQSSLLSFGDFALSCMVSRKWRVAGSEALRMLVHVDFRGQETRVTGRVVRCALQRIAGPSLRSLDLADCRRIRGPAPEAILDRLVATCPKVEKMDIAGCTF